VNHSVYIVDAWRTPFCRAGGALARLTPQQLAVAALQPLRTRLPPGEADRIDDVLLGNVLNGRGNLARYAVLGSALAADVPGCTIDRQCASGMEAVAQAFFRIRAAAGSGTLVCGGVESMSQAPFLMSRAVRAFDRSPPAFLDVPLAPPEAGDPSMIEAAEWVSVQFEISRERMDEYAVRSHQRAITAQADGVFDNQVLPLRAPDESGRAADVRHDQGPRADTSAARLAALRPILTGGRVTAGNASGISDGAAVVVVMGEEALRRSGARPLARVVDVACVGVPPMQMGIGPVAATQRLLERNGIGSGRVDSWELNEAFAGQVLAVAAGLGLDPEAINLEGGAIALGHPLGASGARIVGHLARRLSALPSGRLGVAALCVGGGMGMAMLLEGAK